MSSFSRLTATRRALLVLALSTLVHGCDSSPRADAQGKKKRNAGAADPPPQRQAAWKISRDAADLPGPVAEVRESILAAVHSGRIEDLKTAFEISGANPDLGAPAGIDLIAHLKSVSGDGEGREILAALGLLLDTGYAIVRAGKDIENNAVYVWPYFAETGLENLRPEQEVELYRLVAPAAAKTMREVKAWSWWRLAIGADGVWHTFTKS
jgi:hypothetical protein